MAKHEKIIAEVERIVKDKVSMYRFDLTPSEVYFIRYLLDHKTNPCGSGPADNGDGLRLKKLRDFWPQGSCGFDDTNPYTANKMF